MCDGCSLEALGSQMKNPFQHGQEGVPVVATVPTSSRVGDHQLELSKQFEGGLLRKASGERKTI